MKELILLFIGGGTGSVLRYLISAECNKVNNSDFPLGTLIVNVTGCVLIGLFYSLSTRLNLSAETRLLLTTGLCGGFTTFSTFSNESLLLYRNEEYIILGLYIGLSLILGIGGVILGSRLGEFS